MRQQILTVVALLAEENVKSSLQSFARHFQAWKKVSSNRCQIRTHFVPSPDETSVTRNMQQQIHGIDF